MYICIYVKIQYNIKQRMFAKKNQVVSESRLKQKQHIYSLHYQPKLTAMLLADSDVSQPKQSSSEASRISTYKDKQAQNQTCKYPYSYTHHGYRQQEMRDKNIEPKCSNMAMRIRFSVESFLMAAGYQQQMSAKLQFAIQNLLLSILNIANAIEQQHSQQQRQRGRQSKISIRSSYRSESIMESEQQHRGSVSFTRNNHIKIEQGDELPILCQAEDESSSLSGSIPISDRHDSQRNLGYMQSGSHISKQQYQQYNEIMDRLTNINSRNSTNRLNDYDTEAPYQGNGQRGTQKDRHGNNNKYLARYNTKCGNQTNRQNKLPYNRRAHQQQELIEVEEDAIRQSDDTIRQSDDDYQQQSQQATESEIEIEHESQIRNILPEYCTRSNTNYLSNYTRNLAQQFSQCHTRGHNAKDDDTDEIQYSISQYYIQDSQRISRAKLKEIDKENKQPSVNIAEFKIMDSNKNNSRHKSGAGEDGYLYSHVLSRRKIF